MMLTLTKLKQLFIYTIYFTLALSLNSCHSPESDAKEVCDCYSKTDGNKSDCDNLYKKYSADYQANLSDSMKFQQQVASGITANAVTQMGSAIHQATNELNQSLGNSSESLSNLDQQINQSNQIVKDANKKVEDVKFSFYIYSILLILIGVGLALYGLKYFKTSLALAFVIPSLVLLQMIGWLSMGGFIAIITIGVLIFVFSKPLTYFNAWFFITVALLIPFFMISESYDFRMLITKIIMALSMVVTYLLRKHIKATVIGISSGYCVGLGLGSIICAKLFANGEFFNAFLVPGLIMLTGILLGIAYQYKYLFIKKGIDSSALEYDEKEEGVNLVKTNFKDYLTKKNGIIAGTVVLFILIFFVYQSFSTNTKEASSSSNVVAKDSVVTTTINQSSATDTTSSNQEQVTPTIIEDSTDSDQPLNHDEFIGEWKGKFGNDQIIINIKNINSDGSVTGFDEVKNNRRELTGSLNENEFTLNEPGDDKWDGVFKFSISDGILNGSWSSNNGKLTKEFNLSKTL